MVGGTPDFMSFSKVALWIIGVVVLGIAFVYISLRPGRLWRDAQRTPSRDLDEKSDPTEDVPDDRERRDQ